jgi:hypothetical protein
MSSRTILAMLLASLVAVPALAQEPPADNLQVVREKLQADKKLAVAQGLALTESEATKFWPVYDSYQTDQRAIMDRTIQLIRDYAATFRSMTDSTARRLLDANVTIQRDRVALMESYLPKFRAVLSDTKVARYYQIENKLRAMLDYELAAGIPLVP